MTDTIPALEEQDFTGTAPHDIAAEQSVLGAMMLSRSAIADAVEQVSEEDFYRPTHRLIYEAIMALYGKGHGVDAITVNDHLRTKGLSGQVSAAYLHTLLSVVPVTVNAGDHAKIVREQAALRRLMEAAVRAYHAALNPTGDTVEEVINQAQADIGASLGMRASEDYAPLADIMPDALDEIETNGNRGGEITGVPTGFVDFDALTGGLQGGQMIVVAARPAIGKSTLGVDFARNACIKHDLPGVIFSLEMARREIVARILSAEARVPLHGIRTGHLSDDDWGKIGKKMGAIAEAPLFIDDSPNLTMVQIRAKARRLKEQHGLKFIIIDYLQLMNSGSRADGRQNEVSEISRAIKLLAKELDVPIVAISQLNRGPEQRTDHKPMLSDLRESGSIEQDADMVVLIHRPDAYEKENPRAGEADMVVAKHRNGPTATITVAFQGHYSRFIDMAPNPTAV